MDFNDIQNEIEDMTYPVIEWCDKLYDNVFSDYFVKVQEMYRRFQSDSHPITDMELEYILTTLPLELFTISEKLAELKTVQEVLKLDIKKSKSEIIQNSTAKTQSKKSEEAEMLTIDKQLSEVIYKSVINRVENQISFSKELIMGAKKIWDRRKQSEASNPINPPKTPTTFNNFQNTNTSYTPVFGGKD